MNLTIVVPTQQHTTIPSRTARTCDSRFISTNAAFVSCIVGVGKLSARAGMLPRHRPCADSVAGVVALATYQDLPIVGTEWTDRDRHRARQVTQQLD